MNRPRLIPILQLNGNHLVKTLNFKSDTYVGDPFNAVRIFNEKEVDELAILDISASTEGRGVNFSLLSQLSTECFMPLLYGGGIRSIEDIDKLFNIGVEKVSLNTSVLTNFALLEEAAKKYGSQSIVVSVDIKKNLLGNYSVYSSSVKWKNIIRNPLDHIKSAESAGAGEILLGNVNRDGIRSGYDVDIVKEISRSISIPLIAWGGANSLSDAREIIKHGGASAAAAGSMFVLQGKHKAVLIKYPSNREIESLLD